MYVLNFEVRCHIVLLLLALIMRCFAVPAGQSKEEICALTCVESEVMCRCPVDRVLDENEVNCVCKFSGGRGGREGGREGRKGGREGGREGGKEGRKGGREGGSCTRSMHHTRGKRMGE